LILLGIETFIIPDGIAHADPPGPAKCLQGTVRDLGPYAGNGNADHEVEYAITVVNLCQGTGIQNWQSITQVVASVTAINNCPAPLNIYGPTNDSRVAAFGVPFARFAAPNTPRTTLEVLRAECVDCNYVDGQFVPPPIYPSFTVTLMVTEIIGLIPPGFHERGVGTPVSLIQTPPLITLNYANGWPDIYTPRCNEIPSGELASVQSPNKSRPTTMHTYTRFSQISTHSSQI
jgi:hypothetical protein